MVPPPPLPPRVPHVTRPEWETCRPAVLCSEQSAAVLHQQPGYANNWKATAGQQPQPVQHLLRVSGVESVVTVELELGGWEGPGPEEIMG